jgi:DNA end-binding protein Ku
MWTGTISFSLVAIPVQLTKAVDSGRVSFRMLHEKEYSPLQRKMYCPEEDREVPPDEIVRGYEIGPDKYVLVADEELESVSPERSRTIEIVEFVDLKEVDTIYYDRPYYLVPTKGGEKAYRLLVEVMARTRKAGLAKLILSEREYLVALKSTGAALTVITLHYQDDILSPVELEIKGGEGPGEREVMEEMKGAIRKMTGSFDPAKYADERRKKIIELIKEKVKKAAPVEAPQGVEGEEQAGPADLMAVLEESLKKVKRDR